MNTFLLKKKWKKSEINRMRKSYFIDTLTYVDFQEIVKIGGKVIKVYGGVIYRESFEISPFREDIDKIFAL